MFKAGLNAYTAALKYYQLDGYVTDHINIQTDICQMYIQLFPFYPGDIPTLCKLNKRTVTILEPFIPQLNPASYRTLIGDLAFEVGSAYERLVDLKLEQARRDQAPLVRSLEASPAKPPAVVAQINAYVAGAIRNFRILLAPYDQPDTDYTGFFLTGANAALNTGRPVPLELRRPPAKLPSVPSMSLPLYLSTHFSLARLFSRFVSLDRATVVANLESSLKEYEYAEKFHATLADQSLFAEEVCFSSPPPL